MISALLHVGMVVLCVGLAVDKSIPLPIGVEVMYGEGGVTKAQKVEKVIAKQIETTSFQDDSDVPALENKKEKKLVERSEPQNQKSLGVAQGASERGALSGREGVVGGAEVSAEDRYLYEIQKLIERRKRYPMMAKKMGQTGKVTVRFTLAQDGSLQATEIVQGTPFEILNKAAQDLVEGIDGMKPFPPEIQRTSWVFTVPIEYSLN